MNRAVHLDELPYRPDSCELFERIRPLPRAALLDSNYPHASSGRYDIIAAEPIEAGLPTLAGAAGEAECRAFFEQLGDFHRRHYEGIKPAAQEIPFCGGILGFISYDCGNSLHRVAPRTVGRRAVPRDREPPSAIHLHAYDWCVIQDHLLRRAVLVAQPGVSSARRNDLVARLRDPVIERSAPFRLREPFSSNFTALEYRAAFERVQAYIQAGDCYQVNLAQRFSAACEGDPWQAYRRLRVAAAGPFSAYLDLADGGAAICLSPERFIALHGHHVETSPIKGTRPRHRDAAADRRAARELQTSAKDRAENLMIVDLLRNDLGRSCVPGSIHVDRLFEVQSFPTVHHLVSTISGELQPERGFAELLRDSFPGGSITGAPKRRAMEIIAELEPDERRLYCGTVLYISADGRMDSNIAIRSLLCEDDRILCWAGGGIVADSRWQQEYQETFDKVGKFLRLLEAL